MTAPGFRERGAGLAPGVDAVLAPGLALLLAVGEQSICSGQVVEAAWDRKEPAVMGEGDAGEGLVGTGGTRAALDMGRQGEDTGEAMLGSPRAAAAAAAAAASTWRCCSGACWAASCSCTNIMWSPTRKASVSGERPDRKSLTWGLSPPLSGLWGPCRCHGRLNKMNLYFRKPPPPARPGPGAAGGCGDRGGSDGGLPLPGQLGQFLQGETEARGDGAQLAVADLKQPSLCVSPTLMGP